MNKVPPLIINLKNIYKKHKKHKKHRKHHKHHHHEVGSGCNPPLLEPVELPDREFEDITATTVIPAEEVAARTPETAARTPEAPAKTPETAARTPETAARTPEAPAKTPETAARTPEAPAKTPEAVAVKTPEADAAKTPEAAAAKTPKAGSRISFLRMAEDGSVTMAIIGPTKDQPEDSNERVLNLEQLCGQLSEGTDAIPTDIDEEEYRDLLQVKPIDFVEPSTFGSYLPVRDSTFANLTKDDTDTLLDIYGGNATCYEYAKSLQDYAKGTNYLMTMVDSLLDLLTDGKHRKEAIPIREKIIDEEKQQKEKQGEQKQVELVEQAEEEVQTQLDAIDSLLNDLKQIQERRLSASALPIQPSEEEFQLADVILSKMTKLIKEKAKPGQICDSASIFKALGIPIEEK